MTKFDSKKFMQQIFMLGGNHNNLKLIPISPERSKEEMENREVLRKFKSPQPTLHKRIEQNFIISRRNIPKNKILSKKGESLCTSSDILMLNATECKDKFCNRKYDVDSAKNSGRLGISTIARTTNLKQKITKALPKMSENSKIRMLKNNLEKVNEINNLIKSGKLTHEQFMDSSNAAVIGEGIRLLDVNNAKLQEHFKKICDIKGENFRDYFLTINGFREYIRKRYCPNVTERLIYVMEFPKKARFQKYVECCNNLIRLSHIDKLKLCFGFYDHDYDERISVTDGLLMMRHLTSHDILVQEDLKLLIEAILNKQKLNKRVKLNENLIQRVNIPDENCSKEFEINPDLNIDVSNYQRIRKESVVRKLASTPFQILHPKSKFSHHEISLYNCSEVDNHSTNDTTQIASNMNNFSRMTLCDNKKEERIRKFQRKSKIANSSFKMNSAGSSMSINQVVRQEVKKDNFTSFVNDFSQASVFEPIGVPNPSKKLSKRIDEVCSAFTKKGMHIAKEFNFFERYMENKYLENETDFLSFQEFLKIDFTTFVFNNEVSEEKPSNYLTVSKDNNTLQKTRIMYPSLIYDVYYYLCLYEFPDIKVINEKYYDIIKRQINGEPIMSDKKIIEQRRKSLWRHDKIEFNKLINEFENYKPAVKRIDLDEYFKKSEHK